MKLSDVMSAMHLSTYAEVGLVLFLLAFAVVALDLGLRKRGDLEQQGLLPLDDDGPTRKEGR